MDPLPPSKVLGHRVREHRVLHGLTQADLAIRLTEVMNWPIDRSLVARIESAERQVNVDEIFKLAAALNTAPALLLTPADEVELMLPTPWRPMTSNRVRAWIGDAVPLWEQDRAAYDLSTRTAWVLTDTWNEETNRLLRRIAALHGVETLQELDENTPISERDQAEVDLIDLRLELTMKRHDWESRIGAWTFADVQPLLDRLDRDPLATAAASIKLFKRAPADEVHQRQERTRSEAITTAQESADRHRELIEALISVVEELALELGEPEPPTTPPPRRTTPNVRERGDVA